MKSIAILKNKIIQESAYTYWFWTKVTPTTILAAWNILQLLGSLSLPLCYFSLSFIIINTTKWAYTVCASAVTIQMFHPLGCILENCIFNIGWSASQSRCLFSRGGRWKIFACKKHFNPIFTWICPQTLHESYHALPVTTDTFYFLKKSPSERGLVPLQHYWV